MVTVITVKYGRDYSKTCSNAERGQVDPIVVTYDVYQKFKLDCGFPRRCGEMTTEEYRINGMCRVRKLFNIKTKNRPD